MNTIASHKPAPAKLATSSRRILLGAISIATIAGAAGAIAMHSYDTRRHKTAAAGKEAAPTRLMKQQETATTTEKPAASSGTLKLPQDRWAVSGIELQPTRMGP
ncbi:MAG TPA: hypothetical protein P5307_26020, partial [Pirellulaceae bacterium]|nr:hypothetical protein [Pirellulaceae bacterium]